MKKIEIEEKLKKLLLKRFSLNFDDIENNLMEEHLLGHIIQLSPRDLLYIFVDVEEEFHIQIPEYEISEGNFNTFSGIVKTIENQIAI